MRNKNLKAVLDVGCGYGRGCIYLAKRGFKVTGIDTSAEGLKLARQWAKNENLEVDFQQIDVAKTSFQMTAQLRRAALSIPTNIVEGTNRKSKKELHHFIDIALGSLARLRRTC